MTGAEALLAGEARAAVVVPDLLDRAAAADPERAALQVDGRGTLSYGRWREHADAIAASLVERGIATGDRVALVFRREDVLDFAIAYMGVLKAGATAVCVPVYLEGGSIGELLAELRPAAALGTAVDPVAGQWSLPELAGSRGPAPPPRRVLPSAIAEILYTSGTTGPPEAIAASHENLLAAFGDAAGGPQPHRLVLHALPLGTNAFQSTLLGTLAHGDSIVVLPQFEPRRFWDLIEHQRPAVLTLVPTMAAALLRVGGRERAAAVRTVFVTAAPAPPALLGSLAAAFPNAEVVNTYTSTEAFPARVSTRWDPAHPWSIGWPQESEVRVLDDDGRVLGAGRPGHIQLRSTLAPPRIRIRDGAPAALAGPAGWIATGDIGLVGRDGHLYLVDREPDVIVSGGYNVSSVQVEAALSEHPAVLEAGCVGTPHTTLGETVAAAVVAESELSLAELQAWARGRLPRLARPHTIVFLDALPKTPLGKIDKQRLRAELAPAGRSRRRRRRRTTTRETLVAAIWSEVLRVDAVGPDESFFDLGGDSLSASQVTSRLSTALDAEIPLHALFDFPTVRAYAARLGEIVEARHAGAPIGG
jgi:acyl-CoA synthetase (AMP-forming)/AMP-acid ligase II/acyl carrier protein